jgi:hypothetical protein
MSFSQHGTTPKALGVTATVDSIQLNRCKQTLAIPQNTGLG